MSELPLFPLNTVLFPHTPLQLHIFEPRYRRMIGMCLDDKRPFGVALIRSGSEALGPLAEPFTIGCTAEIKQVQKLNDGRMNLVCVGGERFRILVLDRDREPFLMANVESFPWVETDQGQLAAAGHRLRRRFIGFAERLGTAASGWQLDRGSLPDDPLALALLAGAALEVDPREKQSLLELPGTLEFVQRVEAIYRREAALLRAILDHGDRQGEAPFSVN